MGSPQSRRLSGRSSPSMHCHHGGTRLLERRGVLSMPCPWLCKGGKSALPGCSKAARTRALPSNGLKSVSPRCERYAELTSANFIVHLAPWHLVVINTDVSGNRIGAVLQQTKGPIGDLARGRDRSEQANSFRNTFLKYGQD